MHVFKHPKYYTELRKRNRVARNPMGGYSQSDQAISYDDSTESQGVRPGPGLKPQASGLKLQATSSRQQAKPEPVQVQASSAKRQASQPE